MQNFCHHTSLAILIHSLKEGRLRLMNVYDFIRDLEHNLRRNWLHFRAKMNRDQVARHLKSLLIDPSFGCRLRSPCFQ